MNKNKNVTELKDNGEQKVNDLEDMILESKVKGATEDVVLNSEEGLRLESEVEVNDLEDVMVESKVRGASEEVIVVP